MLTYQNSIGEERQGIVAKGNQNEIRKPNVIGQGVSFANVTAGGRTEGANRNINNNRAFKNFRSSGQQWNGLEFKIKSWG